MSEGSGQYVINWHVLFPKEASSEPCFIEGGTMEKKDSFNPEGFRSPGLQKSTLVEALMYRYGLDPPVTDGPFFVPLKILQLNSETRHELHYLFVLPSRSLHAPFTKSWRWRGYFPSLSSKISLKIGVLLAQHLQLN